jgi:signal transduction histidine kinase
MFQEMLTNVERHARANRVTVQVQQIGDRLLLRVRDNGCGVPLESSSRKSYGLLGMKERALLLGGHVTVERAKPRGTTVTVTVPLANRRTQSRRSASRGTA